MRKSILMLAALGGLAINQAHAQVDNLPDLLRAYGTGKCIAISINGANLVYGQLRSVGTDYFVIHAQPDSPNSTRAYPFPGAIGYVILDPAPIPGGHC